MVGGGIDEGGWWTDRAGRGAPLGVLGVRLLRDREGEANVLGRTVRPLESGLGTPKCFALR